MYDIRHEIIIDAPADKVSRAITTQEGLRSWWTADSTVQEKAGSVAVFKFLNGSVIFRMRIDELVPGKKVSWTCLGDPEEWKGTKLVFSLELTDNRGTNLNFIHSGWRSVEGDYPLCNTTWGHLMYILKEYAEGGSPGPMFQG
ncbi:MAG: SRPBCC domain-containing protein [Nitrospirota bacterium]